MKNMFLETITTLDNDVLIPIDRIKYIHKKYDNGLQKIRIVSDDGDWIECFDNEEKRDLRYNEIKKIINKE